MRAIVQLIIATVLVGVCSAQTLKLPSRPPTAPEGKELVKAMTPLTLADREEYIFQQVTNGNVPNFLRKFVALTNFATINGTNHTLQFYVAPDYFALGSDADYLLTPMTPMLAQRVATFLDCTLATRKISDDIWKAAKVKMTPTPIPPTAKMITVPIFDEHNQIVRTQRLAQISTHPLGELVAGDKKDIVISTLIYTNLHTRASTPVVIYGWHKADGKAIQPIYNGHAQTWADYSHGIRLVQQAAVLDGKPTTISAILTNASYAALLSDETNFAGNIIPRPYYPTAY
ncbi:MAG: hypothetical protein ACXWIU_04625 [Limisphaerales bacterium]